MAKRLAQNDKNFFQDKLPPQNIEAEESLISSILIDNNTLSDIVEVLTPDDFYRSSHQKIFEVCLTLYEQNEPIDLVTLNNALKENGDLEKVGGTSFLAKLLDTVPVAANAAHYAKIVRNKASLRHLLIKSNEITKRCLDDRGDIEEIIDFAESTVFEISERNIKPSFYPLSNIIEINIDALEERQGNKTLVTGVTTGYNQLDHMTSGFQPSDLIILAARPSMGKTALAMNIARNAAVMGGVSVAVFSLEMSKEQLSMRLLCSESRVDSFKLRGGFISDDDWNNLTNAAGTLSQAPMFIDDSASISSLEIRAKARRLKKDANLGLLIIDYLQLMRGSSGTERRDLEISEISRSLKGLAKELNLPIIALSQLNRKLEERSDKRPQLSDLRESGSLEQDADVVAFIYRDEVYNKDENNPNIGKAEVIIAKQRNGPVGSVSLAFINKYTRFENLQQDYN
ncbi:replicative DNA helicase [Desulfobacterales bacterium HSG16]|nr:replicative DNA helicase [Desulfobacterales bacterium HSG16]